MSGVCCAELTDGLLVLSTGRMTRTYDWQSGLLSALALALGDGGGSLALAGGASCALPGQTNAPVAADLTVAEVSGTPSRHGYLAATVTCVFASGLELRRVFRLYDHCPAIACDYYVRRAGRGSWTTAAALQVADMANVEQSERLAEGAGDHVVTERLRLPGVHWRARAVDFADVTDRCNNLVSEREVLPYRGDSMLTGNILLMRPSFGDTAVFVLKEAPCAPVQLGRPPADFVLRIGDLSVLGLGLRATAAAGDEWVRGYSVVVGLSANDELSQLSALRDYQSRLRVFDAARDEMVMMNTWGDRNQDTRMGEAFALREIDAAKRLGITHLQLDDGWQTGVSCNTGRGISGSLDGIWQRADYWEPRAEVFPRGLRPVVEYGREQGVELCLWFNPSKDDSYAHWRDDADTLIRLHSDYGIRIFKIDGVFIGDKRAEVNLRRMFDAVTEATDGAAVFNLDCTAGRRYGYHFFYEYGNIFLENRYTDWGNYYPHWTLRNLWHLSKYVPTRRLQIEFLNTWRNGDKYGDDPLAPGRYSFEYCFAITMMAQPLAWFEGTGLPEEAFALKDVLLRYREHALAMHSGLVLPLGDEPSGLGWTGFQSIADARSGYVLIFREDNPRGQRRLALYGGEGGCRYRLTLVVGAGTDQTVTVDSDGRIDFALPQPRSYALYRYMIERENGE